MAMSIAKMEKTGLGILQRFDLVYGTGRMQSTRARHSRISNLTTAEEAYEITCWRGCLCASTEPESRVALLGSAAAPLSRRAPRRAASIADSHRCPTLGPLRAGHAPPSVGIQLSRGGLSRVYIPIPIHNTCIVRSPSFNTPST